MSSSSWGSPFGYLDSSGPRASAIVPLTWFTLIVSVVVIGDRAWTELRARR